MNWAFRPKIKSVGGFVRDGRTWSVLALVLTALVAQTTGCARRGSDALVTTCVLPDDQVGTLSGRWKVPPIPIAFNQGDFSAHEMWEIMQAATTWNLFYAESLGLQPIDYGTDDSPRVASIPKPNAKYACSQTVFSDAQGAFTAPIVIYKVGSWPYPNQPNAMALTTFCKGAGSPLPYFNMAMIEINYQNFFSTGKRQPDLQTIVLHEFGHLLGLNHSCEATGSTGVPACSSANGGYISAVMYPDFRFNSAGYGETKRALTANDQGRANCLYMYAP